MKGRKALETEPRVSEDGCAGTWAEDGRKEGRGYGFAAPEGNVDAEIWCSDEWLYREEGLAQMEGRPFFNSLGLQLYTPRNLFESTEIKKKRRNELKKESHRLRTMSSDSRNSKHERTGILPANLSNSR